MEELLRYFPNLSEKQIRQFEQLGALYPEWNEKINVISRKDIDHLYTRHILHSLAIAKVIDFKPGTEVLDVGTGGGFPGIPLAILFPKVQFTLTDSIAKKMSVVKGISESLGLTNVTILVNRAENVQGEFDFITCRAVTRMKKFIPWIRKKVNRNQFHELNNGILALKGGDLSEELAEINQNSKLWDISEFFEDEFFETKKVVHVSIKG